MQSARWQPAPRQGRKGGRTFHGMPSIVKVSVDSIFAHPQHLMLTGAAKMIDCTNLGASKVPAWRVEHSRWPGAAAAAHHYSVISAGCHTALQQREKDSRACASTRALSHW